MVIIPDAVDFEESTEPPLRRPSLPSEPLPPEQGGKNDCTLNHTRERASFHANGATFTSGESCSHAHILHVDHLSHVLRVDPKHGLSDAEAASRLERDGPNKVEGGQKISMWQILLRQISNSLTLVLLITMILSFSLDDYIEGAVITAVILLNIVVGFVQDYRAEKTILSLQALSAPTCKVIRNSQVDTIKAESLVVGDVIQLAVGDIVPADTRLINGVNFTTDEALLTGESVPIQKTFRTLSKDDIPIGDRTNMAYSASTVTQGRAQGLVIATGMRTEVGKISALLRQKHTNGSHNIFRRAWSKFTTVTKHALGMVGSPLQVKLSKFALLLFALALLLAIIVFSANFWDVEDEVLIYGICVAVAVIPESLIAVLTITIAIGTKAMAKGNVIVRQMSALEAVGGVTNICSDKTGTLTQGKMIARKVMLPGIKMTIKDTTNSLDPTSGKIDIDAGEKGVDQLELDPRVLVFLDIIALCNLASVTNLDKAASDSSSGITFASSWTAVGEPTEIALQVLAMRFGHGKTDLLARGDRKLLAEHSFDSTCKRMTVVYSSGAGGHADILTKGAVEAVVPMLSCSAAEIDKITATADSMAADGLRVLCLARKTVIPADSAGVTDRAWAESNLEYAGLVGLYDPPRNETAEAVRKCQVAGIKVHMLTGDHIRTAVAIAEEVGIIKSAASAFDKGRRTAMLASDFDKLTDTEIDNIEELPLVLARCSPSTKVRMVEALHRRKCFCVMTGDGVNDSPALKRADVGIAMGLNGSDVAKQAADMVLVDDDFASIVRAVEEGRRLFDNIQKFLLHLLTSNIAQVLLLLIGLAFKDQNNNSVFPLAPLEILWVNLITSSFLALGLGLESAVPDIMLRPPHPLRVGVFTKELIIDKMVYGTTMGALCLVASVAVVYTAPGGGAFSLGRDCNQDFNGTCDVVFRARATVFAVLTFTLLATAWEVKDFRRSLFNMRHVVSVDVNVNENEKEGKASTMFSVFPTVYENKFLFWAVAAGFSLTFPIIYLPVVNSLVFKHMGITWEWGVVFGCLVVYVVVIEAWKAVKRKVYHQSEGKIAKAVAEGEPRRRENDAV